MRRSLWLLVAVSLGLGAGRAAEPVLAFSFDRAEAVAAPTVGAAAVSATAVAWAASPRGGALQLDGEGGLELPADSFHAGTGFAIACWLNPSDVDRNACVVSKRGEFLLRLDPPNEGSRLSFFVNADGKLEPRVRGPQLAAGRWTHVIAGWDGQEAMLWVDGQEFTSRRGGRVTPSDGPLLVGLPEQWAPSGWRGQIDELRFFGQPLTAAEAALESLGIDLQAPGAESRDRFDFRAGDQGWQPVAGARLATGPAGLAVSVDAFPAAIARTGLAVPLAGQRWLGVRLVATSGRRARLVYRTDRGLGSVAFDLLADGRPHCYLLRADDDPVWGGALRGLCLLPIDQAGTLTVSDLIIAAEPDLPADIIVERVLPAGILPRAGRDEVITAQLTNRGGPAAVTATLALSPGATVHGPTTELPATLAHGQTVQASWRVTAPAAGSIAAEVTVAAAGAEPVRRSAAIRFSPALDLPPADYVPAPQPVSGPYLVGAHYCPLWKQGTRSSGWELIVPYPEREPALGWYDEHDPEVTDWEIKWAVEHGIDFFIYCWYRSNAGAGGVSQRLSHGIHEGLMNARYRDQMKFTIMWENNSVGSGVTGEDDFLKTLLPFWIDAYFRHPSYLLVDGKPVLYIYRPEKLVDELGGPAGVRRAFDLAREQCRAAGFDGLWLLGEYRGTQPERFALLRELGLDYVFSYCNPIGNDPPPDRAVAAQEELWATWRQLPGPPQVLTVSMGWDSTPWHGRSASVWRLPPADFQQLCERVKPAMAAQPEGSLGQRMVLLDNWNEWGEGHYLMPHRESGFGYLDAIRAAFVPDAPPHQDLVPQDVGRGPYDSLWQAWLHRQELARRTVTAPGGDEAGLLAWYRFDEEPDSQFAWDWSGNGRGGFLAGRFGPGRVGQGLVCDGGAATVPANAFDHDLRAMTVTCWIRTETPGQNNTWFINSIFGDGATGFRLGMSGGRLTFAAPVTSWSHHLPAAEPLPTGRWVAVAAVYDGTMMRLYQDGRLVGELPRLGPIKASRYQLALGNFDVGHSAHFHGWLDEVRIYGRVLPAERLAELAR